MDAESFQVSQTMLMTSYSKSMGFARRRHVWISSVSNGIAKALSNLYGPLPYLIPSFCSTVPGRMERELPFDPCYNRVRDV